MFYIWGDVAAFNLDVIRILIEYSLYQVYSDFFFYCSFISLGNLFLMKGINGYLSM